MLDPTVCITVHIEQELQLPHHICFSIQCPLSSKLYFSQIRQIGVIYMYTLCFVFDLVMNVLQQAKFMT
jgi:hypothetical protein